MSWLRRRADPAGWVMQLMQLIAAATRLRPKRNNEHLLLKQGVGASDTRYDTGPRFWASFGDNVRGVLPMKRGIHEAP